MSKKDLPAFPVPREVMWHGTDFPCVGMTLRDYFAAQAMTVFLNNNDSTWEEDAADAYAVADKLLEARHK